MTYPHGDGGPIDRLGQSIKKMGGFMTGIPTGYWWMKIVTFKYFSRADNKFEPDLSGTPKITFTWECVGNSKGEHRYNGQHAMTEIWVEKPPETDDNGKPRDSGIAALGKTLQTLGIDLDELEESANHEDAFKEAMRLAVKAGRVVDGYVSKRQSFFPSRAVKEDLLDKIRERAPVSDTATADDGIPF